MSTNPKGTTPGGWLGVLVPPGRTKHVQGQVLQGTKATDSVCTWSFGNGNACP